jgi:serine/threonine protein kinase/Tol biopolymer transport system component
MELDRWSEVEKLYHEALDREPSERAAFLDHARADEQVRREVESLLEHEQEGDLLLENPQWQLQSSLPIGTTLGPYKIISAIGAGGMGEVYRAHDSKLGRDVAIKTLPYEFARDRERLARLRHEARTLASLNHPCIAAIYGLEEIGEGECLVLELVEGETLRGPLPLVAALDQASQVAQALEVAHDKGIIHRDLKPANVKVTPEGRVKVLDFGLAKAIWGTDENPDLSETATLSGLDTIGGHIVGTPGYMSPEQALGRGVDKRTDIWAFGCLLYELLTGERVFQGETVQATIAAVLEREPDWQSLPSNTPGTVRELLRRCLEKDASRRPSNMAEVRATIEKARYGFGHWRMAWIAAALAILGLVSVLWLRNRLPRLPDRSQWIQLTNFADSAAGPALSPDGRRIVFFRSTDGFATAGPVYAKTLPDGDAVQITDDPRNKYGLAFSPDGSQIAYTVWEGDAKFQWQTFTVPALGGKPSLLFANAAGLTWLDKQRLLYSEIRSGLHMGVVTSSLTRTDRREIYFPDHERRMAHHSCPSPDRKWALITEMEPGWLPCRIIPLDGSSSGREVGPRGPCTAAAWSPEGKWMYFGAEVHGANHLWRQRFPDGEPEQITFGPTDEEGLAIAPDGRSLITSVGVPQSAVWLHDVQGDHAISAEGYAAANYLLLTAPMFSRDGRHLYYLLRRESPGSANELWRANLDTMMSEPVIRGFPILEFDISGDARSIGEVVFSSQQPGGMSQLWLAPLDRNAPPRRITGSGEGSPHFGPNGTVWFRYSDGKANFVGLMNKDGSGRQQVSTRPISTVMSSSPDGRWLVVMAPTSDNTAIDTIAIPAEVGGKPRVIGRGRYPVTWARDGRFVYIGVQAKDSQTVAIPVSPGELPELPDGGIRSLEQASALRGARLIEGMDISPGPDPSIFAYIKTTTHRNLFRISLR